MNNEKEILALLNSVLGMAEGDSRILRERHIGPCTVHRYRDGWYVFADQASDRNASSQAILGWFFNHVEDLADFLIGALHDRHQNFYLMGERQ